MAEVRSRDATSVLHPPCGLGAWQACGGLGHLPHLDPATGAPAQRMVVGAASAASFLSKHTATNAETRSSTKSRLNPFDIRATDRTKMEEEGVESTTVLIPLISGQPIGQMLSLSYLQETGLNPFDIRATDRTVVGLKTSLSP